MKFPIFRYPPDFSFGYIPPETLAEGRMELDELRVALQMGTFALQGGVFRRDDTVAPELASRLDAYNVDPHAVRMRYIGQWVVIGDEGSAPTKQPARLTAQLGLPRLRSLLGGHPVTIVRHVAEGL